MNRKQELTQYNKEIEIITKYSYYTPKRCVEKITDNITIRQAIDYCKTKNYTGFETTTEKGNYYFYNNVKQNIKQKMRKINEEKWIYYKHSVIVLID